MDIPLEALFHGNFINSGLFVSHLRRNVDSDPDNRKALFNILSALHPNNRGTLLHYPSLVVDFEHDRNIFTIAFPTRDG